MAAVKQKKRGQVNRSRTKLILIAAEGRNKTEKLYFHELFQNNKDYRVRFTSSTETDPVGIVASAVQYIQSEELDLKNGLARDLGFLCGRHRYGYLKAGPDQSGTKTCGEKRCRTFTF